MKNSKIYPFIFYRRSSFFFKLNCAIVIPLLILYAVTIVVATQSGSFLVGIIVGVLVVGIFGLLILLFYDSIDEFWGSLTLWGVVFLLIFLSLAQFNWYCTGWSLAVPLFITLICVIGFCTGVAIGYCAERPRINTKFEENV